MKKYIVIVTRFGTITKFESKDVRPQHRGGRGLRGMMVKTEGGTTDEVVAAFLVEE